MTTRLSDGTQASIRLESAGGDKLAAAYSEELKEKMAIFTVAADALMKVVAKQGKPPSDAAAATEGIQTLQSAGKEAECHLRAFARFMTQVTGHMQERGI
jgi:hypothetical protein